MSYLSSSPVSLAGVLLQTEDAGLTTSLEYIDNNKPWLARDFIASLRATDDSLSFDMESITGARTRLTYGIAGPTVPINNDLAINSLYSKQLKTRISVKVNSMDTADVTSLTTLNNAHQLHWATKRALEARIMATDISYTKYTEILNALNALTLTPLAFVAPGLNGNVFFEEGNGISFSSYIDGIAYSGTLELISLVDL